jgi:hypothetical protein
MPASTTTASSATMMVFRFDDCIVLPPYHVVLKVYAHENRTGQEPGMYSKAGAAGKYCIDD